ncbi:hypothetical protein [Tropicimonas sp. IMCC34043]
MNPKPHAVTDALGHPIRIVMSTGQVGDGIESAALQAIRRRRG